MSKFDDIKSQFEEKINEVHREIEETEQKIAQYAADYRDSMSAYALEGGKHHADTVSYSRSAWRIETEKLEDHKERLSILETAKDAKLKEAFPELVKENRAAIEAIYEEYRKAGRELMKIRADILLRLRELWKIGGEAGAVESRTAYAARIAGVEYRGRVSLPVLNLSSQYEGTDQNLIPTAHEVFDALKQGQVPSFVHWYGISGEIVSNQEADAKLRQHKEANK